MHKQGTDQLQERLIDYIYTLVFTLVLHQGQKDVYRLLLIWIDRNGSNHMHVM